MSATVTAPSFVARSIYSRRVLLVATAGSAALHAAVLVGIPDAAWETPAAPPVLTATLVPQAAEPAPEPPPRPEKRAREAGAHKAPEPRPVELPPPRPVLQPAQPAVEPPAPHKAVSSSPPAPPASSIAASPAEDAAPEVLAMPAPADPAPTVSVAPAPAFAAAPASPSPAAAGATQPPAAPTPDKGSLDRYRLALIGQAKRYTRYPPQAMERGWSGKVEVRLVIGADGMIRDTLVKSSSGHDVLDRQAVDMVRKAKPLTPIPPALRGREFAVDVPVIFDLKAG